MQSLQVQPVVSVKLDVHLTYDPAITFGPSSQKIKTYAYTKTWTRRSMPALFIIYKNYIQPKFPSVGGEWLKKL